MLDHEQAAIVADYKPKPNKNNNNPNPNRRHSSISQSMQWGIDDIRRYTTSSGVFTRKDAGKSLGRHGYSRIPENDAYDPPLPLNTPQSSNRSSGESEIREAVSYIAAMENIHFRTLEGYYCWLQASGKVKLYISPLCRHFLTIVLEKISKNGQIIYRIIFRNFIISNYCILVRAYIALS
jgi:hypothetical protein